jgi:uncharacterized MAPEG superfamily protein
MLLAFATWTLLLMTIGVGVYRWVLILLGAAELTSFPGDTPHGHVAYRRVVRAHANCLENLPVFAVIVLVGAVTGLHPAGTDALAAMTMGARIVQSSVHMLFREQNTTVAVRFSFFLVQVAAMIVMSALLAQAAVHAPLLGGR